MTDRTVSILAVLRDQVSGPLLAARRGLESFRGAVEQTRAAAIPFSGTIGTVAAGFLSLRAAQSAIASGESGANAVSRLNAALDGSIRTRQQIVRVTEEIQSVTTIADDKLQSIAASMAAMGVSAAELPRLLKLSAQVSTALNESIEGVADDLAKIAVGGDARGLNRRIDGLRALAESGASAEEKLRFLETRYVGFAEAVAQTDFGRARQGLNVLDDQMERIGAALIRIKASVVSGLAGVVENLANASESRAFGVFVEFLSKAAAAIPVVVTGMLALAVAFRALDFVTVIGKTLINVPIMLVQATTASAAWVAALGPIPLIIAGVAAALVGILGALGVFDEFFSGVGELASATTDNFSEAVGLLADGKIEATAFFEYVTTKIQQIGIIVKTPFQIAGTLFVGLFNTAKGFIGLLVYSINTAFYGVLRGIEIGLNKLVRGFVETFDAILGTDQASVLKESNIFGGILAESTKGVEESLDLLVNSIPNAMADVFKLATRATFKVVALEVESQKRIRDAVDETLAKRVDAARRELDVERDKLNALVAERDRLQAKIQGIDIFKDALLNEKVLSGIGIQEAKALLQSIGTEAQKPLRDLLVREFTAQFEGGRIAAKEFVDFRRELEIGLIDDLVKIREGEATTQKDRLSILREQEDLLRQQVGTIGLAASIATAFNAKNENALDATKIAVDLEQKRVENAKEQKDAAAQLAKIEQTITELLQSRVASLATLADERKRLAGVAAAEAREAATQLGEDAKRVLESVARGAESPIDAMRRLDALFAGLDETILSARERVAVLLGSGEGGSSLTNELTKILAELDRISNSKVELTVSLGGSIERSLDAAQQEFEKVLSNIQTRVQAGEALPSTQFNVANAAAARFQSVLAQVSVSFQSLIEKNPALAADFETLREKIDAAGASLEKHFRSSDGGSASSFFEGVLDGTRRVTGEFENLRTVGANLGASLVNNLVDGLVNVWNRGSKAMQQFFSQLFQFIAQSIAKILIFKAIAAGLSVVGLAGAAGGAGGGAGGNAASIPFVGEPKAAGGLIHGPNIQKDIIPAWLMPGEFVQRLAAVQHYGVAFMDAVNRKAFPKDIATSFTRGPYSMPTPKDTFATGGAVVRGAGSGGAPPVLTLTEDMLARMLAQSPQAMFRFSSRHQREMRSALGIV